MSSQPKPSHPQTPADLGFRMPAEWEPHQATWLTWPRPEGISFPDRYEVIPPFYAGLIRQLIPHEEVHINVWNEAMASCVRSILTDHKVPLDNVFLHPFPAYEPWCRDHGPIFLVRERSPQNTPARAIVDWGYNAWGGKYPPYDLDDAVPQHVAHLRQLPLFSPGIVMEGGSIDVNGCGSLLTTTSCLLNPNRNPQLNQVQIENYLKTYLGQRQILWLGEGIAGDDTDGHVDDITRFISPHTIVTVVEEDPADENYQPLQENLHRLQSFRDQDGQPFQILSLPMPRRIELQGQRLPASYANFYIANNVILLPTYRDPNDAKAVAVLQKACPSRKVVAVDCTDLIWGLGSIHCITKQEPLGEPATQ